MRFDGKSVLITGGGTGIGRAIAHGFAAEGARVAICGRRTEPVDAVTRELRGSIAIRADIAKPESAPGVIQRVTDAFGRLDVVINNAACFVNKPLAELTDADIIDTFGTNLAGPLALVRSGLEPLTATKGSVVNISSTVARHARPNLALYSSSKLGLEQMTRSLAAELGPTGVRVNCVAPGATETYMISGRDHDAFVAATPLGRLGQPEDIVPAVLFLAAPEASWITGQVVQASGGFQL